MIGNSVHTEEIKKEFQEPRFLQITEERLEELKKELSASTGVDFTALSTRIVSPGDPMFDTLELYGKLFSKNVNQPEILEAVRKNVGKYRVFEKDGIDAMREMAKNMGIEADGALEGLVYTVVKKIIVYPTVLRKNMISMARTYAAKEGISGEIKNEKEAEELLRQLAEKYFFHEAGHIVYFTFPKEFTSRWEIIANNNPKLISRVLEVQENNINSEIGKHSSHRPVLVGREAFADIFSEIVTHGKMKNRLGDFPEETEFVKQSLQVTGIRV